MENYQSIKWENMEMTNDPDRFTAEMLLPLYAQTYWADKRPLDVIEKSLKNSMTFVAFDGEKPIAMVRLVTDYATFAYLCDVLVDQGYRGRGISKWMLGHVFSHPEIATLRRICLMTMDAQGLYRQFGFENLEQPEKYMEILRV